MKRSVRLRGRGARAAVLLALALLLAATPRCSHAAPPATPPPPESSVAGAVETVRLALLFAGLLPASQRAAHDAVAAARGACAPLDEERPCVPEPLAACAAAVGALFDALGVAAADTDPLDADFARAARGLVGDATWRLAWARDALAAGRCDAPPGEIPARLVLAGDASLDVRPLRALRAGRGYAVVARGAAAADLAALRRSPGLPPPGDDRAVPPRLERAAFPPAEVVARYDRLFAGRPLRFRDADARALLQRLAAQPAADGVGALPSFRLELAQPLTARVLESLRLAFVPERRADAAQTVARFRTRDVRAAFAARRTALTATACSPSAGVGATALAEVRLPGFMEPVYRGSVPSLAVDAAPDPDAGAAAPRVPFLLALPRGWTERTPVVLLLHGHGSRAEAFLRAHGPALLARGLGALAMELPGEGERQSEGPFIDALAPERLPRSIEQAATDAIALIHVARTCGFALPGERAYRPREVLLLGYSVGSMIGTVVRAVEPRLGATVLLAPGGELVEWPIAQVPKRLGAEAYTVCRDGPRHGEPCPLPDVCTPAGTCTVDPQLNLLRETVRFAYEDGLAAVEPTAFAVERTGAASEAPLLLIAGGQDFTLTPLMVARLADAYGMRPSAEGGRRGPRSRLLWWPELGHEIAADQRVRAQAYDFLAAAGRRAQGAR